MDTTSLVICNKNRIVVAIAAGTWVISLMFTIQSELLRLLSREGPGIHSNMLLY
jgi:hypothetical protein